MGAYLGAGTRVSDGHCGLRTFADGVPGGLTRFGEVGASSWQFAARSHPRVPTPRPGRLPPGEAARQEAERWQHASKRTHGERQTSAELELERRPMDVACRVHDCCLRGFLSTPHFQPRQPFHHGFFRVSTMFTARSTDTPEAGDGGRAYANLRGALESSIRSGPARPGRVGATWMSPSAPRSAASGPPPSRRAVPPGEHVRPGSRRRTSARVPARIGGAGPPRCV